MNKDNKEILRPTKADGIQEFDNALPRWWVGLFYLCIILGVGYGVHLHFMGGETLIQAYDAQMAAQSQQSQQSGGLAAEGGSSEGSENAARPLAERMKDEANIREGKAIFATNCAPCHGPDGGGVIGPNLTDKYWIHGNTPEDLVRVIGEGVPEKGMVAWTPVFGLTKVEHVAAYVLSQVGTSPATAKAPEGNLFE
jgi:cytochrome c oxidase cbb3-type subunit 3